MDNTFYQKQFESALAAITMASPASPTDFPPSANLASPTNLPPSSHITPAASGLLYFAGPVLGAIAFKIYKPEWASDPATPLTSSGRIFFSIWVTDRSIRENKLLYNIHALKLRQFKTHRLPSRDFAARFRTLLKPHLPDWPNLSIDFGPLTLMQGWIPLNPNTLQSDIIRLAQKFETISPLIDQTIATFKSRTV